MASIIITPDPSFSLLPPVPRGGIYPLHEKAGIDGIGVTTVNKADAVTNKVIHFPQQAEVSKPVPITHKSINMRKRIENWDLFINVIGTARQLLLAGMNSYIIRMLRRGLSATQSALNWMNLFNTFTLAFTGISYMAEVLFGTGPESREAYKKAVESVRILESAVNETNGLKEGLKDAYAEYRMAFANCWNYFWTFCVGAAQTTSSIVNMLAESAVKNLHYSPVLVGSAAQLAELVSGIALGAFYLARGIFYIWRATEGLLIVHRFKTQFQAAGTRGASSADKIENMMQFMRRKEKYVASLNHLDTEKQMGKNYLGRRLNSEFLKNTDGSIYSADGIIEANRSDDSSANGIDHRVAKPLKPYASNTEKLKYLKAIDKGIYSEELKNKLALVLGIFLVLVGISIIVASIVLSGGMTIAIIGLVCAIFYTFRGAALTGRHSAVLAWFRDWSYSEPEWLKKLECDEAILDAYFDALLPLDMEIANEETDLIMEDEDDMFIVSKQDYPEESTVEDSFKVHEATEDPMNEAM